MVLVTATDADRSERFGPTEASAWLVLGWVGLAFVVSGSVDFALLWFPTDFGNPQWEFGTVTQSFNGLPILLVGLAMLEGASRACRRRWWHLVAMGGAGLLLTWLMLGVVLWALNIPLALGTVPDELRPGVRDAIVKTTVQSVTYGLVLSYLIGSGWMTGPSRGRGRRLPE